MLLAEVSVIETKWRLESSALASVLFSKFTSLIFPAGLPLYAVLVDRSSPHGCVHLPWLPGGGLGGLPYHLHRHISDSSPVGAGKNFHQIQVRPNVVTVCVD